jgi:hypothetical protein
MSIMQEPKIADVKIAEITGRTRVLGILAHPTEHVKAPPGINRIAMMRGKDAVMVPFNVAPGDLDTFVAGLRVLKSFDGAIVTVPHKQAIIRLCDEVSPQALAVGAPMFCAARRTGGSSATSSTASVSSRDCAGRASRYQAAAPIWSAPAGPPMRWPSRLPKPALRSLRSPIAPSRRSKPSPPS